MLPVTNFLSAHARYAQRAAEACGYTFRSLDGADGYLVEVRDGALTASGPLAETVTASALSHTFDIAVELDVTRGRYRARSTTH